MQTRFLTVVLLGFVVVAVAACGGGSGGLTLAEEEALRQEAQAAEMKAQEAEADAARAVEARKVAEEARKAAEQEAERKAVAQEATRQAELEAAQQRAADAEREAQEALEEAERQADDNVRAGLLIPELSGTISEEEDMEVEHMPGGRLTFSRPNALPAKGSAPSVPGSWSSASYSGPRGSVGTDTVYLYTNIQAPSSKAFWKEHGESVTPLTGGAADFAETATVTSFGTGRSLYRNSDGDAEPKPNGSRSGTYGGYSGTFKCETGCNIAVAADGALTFIGDWTFTATSLSAKRSSARAEQDSEFLYFGIWAYEPTNPTATATPEFKWAAGGDGSISESIFTALTGEATFTGGAIGKYALAKATGRGARVARTGTFTATATFTADFGGSTGTGETLSGRITNFKEGGADLGSDWNIFLGSSASEAATLAATGVTTGEASGAIDGDNTTTGAWSAALHGSDNEDMSAVTGYTAAKYPMADVAGVAGWFNAAAGMNAAIAGAFGAACTAGTMCAK